MFQMDLTQYMSGNAN